MESSWVPFHSTGNRWLYEHIEMSPVAGVSWLSGDLGAWGLGWGWDVQSAVTCRRRSLPMIYYCSSSNPATGVRVHGQLAPKFLNLNGHGEGETIGLCPSELPRIQCAGAWTVKFCVYFYLIKVKFLHNKKQLYDSKALHDPLAIVSLSAFTS